MRRITGLSYAVSVVSSLVLAAWLTSCGLTGPVDRSLLTGEPCEPPCWQGLVPGVSTEQEVESALRASEYVDPDSVYPERSGGARIISWESTAWWTASAEPNAFILDGDTLMVISMQLDYELTLEDLLDRYGPPHKVWTQWRDWGSVDALVNLYYPSIGLIPQLVLEPSAGQHELEPHSQVIRVWYCPGSSLEGLADLGSSIPFPPREYMESALHDWAGYGTLKEDWLRR